MAIPFSSDIDTAALLMCFQFLCLWPHSEGDIFRVPIVTYYDVEASGLALKGRAGTGPFDVSLSPPMSTVLTS